VKKILRGVAAAAAGVTLVVATGGIASAKDVSNDQYAKKLCGSVNAVLDDVGELEPSSSTDPAAYQTETVESLDSLIASMEKATTKLRKLSPEDGGTKVAKLFNKYLKELTGNIEDARDEFAAADASSPAFTGAVTVLTVGLQNSALGIDDPFAELSDNQDLLEAFDDEKSCEDIVTVI
jgi:hypothetical protein